MSAAGKLEMIEALLGGGLIDSKTARGLLGIKDIEPKFKIGDNVWHKHGFKAIVDYVEKDCDFNTVYHLKGQDSAVWWKEEVLISEFDGDFEELLKNDKE